MAHDSPKKCHVDEPQPKTNIINGRRKHGITHESQSQSTKTKRKNEKKMQSKQLI